MRIQTWLYSAAQALTLTSAVITVSISAMVGKSLAPSASLSTLSYGAQFAAIIFCSYLLSMAMKRFGRKPVFYLGALTLALGGGLGALSIYLHSFATNVIAHIFFGVSLSAFAYFRFAATDGVEGKEKAKVLSIVTLGGIVAAFVGPQIAKGGRLFFEDYVFSGSYLAFVFIALALFIILLSVPKDEKTALVAGGQADIPKGAENKVLSLPLYVAIYASGFGYMLMGLLMMQSSMALNAQGFSFADSMFVIQCHVVAMFVPSLFMGRVIAKVGAQTVIFGGYLMMLVAMILAIYTSGYYGILAALIGIGLGWNMLYVGGSALVASLPGDQHKLQGINESAVAVLNTIGAFSAGALFFAIGWENTNWLAMLLLIPGVLLLLANRYQRSIKEKAVSV